LAETAASLTLRALAVEEGDEGDAGEVMPALYPVLRSTRNVFEPRFRVMITGLTPISLGNRKL